MKELALPLGTAALLTVSAAQAAELSIPNRFQADTRAVADQVNANFDAVRGAVNEALAQIQDNAQGVQDNATAIGQNKGAIEANQAATQGNTQAIEALQNGGSDSCPEGMADIGAFCIDQYEVSVVDRNGAPYDPSSCIESGTGACVNVAFAQSAPNVAPSGGFTWFQAAAACANAGKRLPTNQEWQVAALGTDDLPDDGIATCATNSAIGNTGSRSECVSSWGVYDMIGNLAEWTGDWMAGYGSPTNSSATTGALYRSDGVFQVRPAEYQGRGRNLPAAIVRGGDAGDGTDAGIFYVAAHLAPGYAAPNIGFRCAVSK